jgi:hypothetical protein
MLAVLRRAAALTKLLLALFAKIFFAILTEISQAVITSEVL